MKGMTSRRMQTFVLRVGHRYERSVEEGGPMFLKVEIVNEKVDIEVDTSSYISVMSSNDKDQLLPNTPLEAFSESMVLNCYGGQKTYWRIEACQSLL